MTFPSDLTPFQRRLLIDALDMKIKWLRETFPFHVRVTLSWDEHYTVQKERRTLLNLRAQFRHEQFLHRQQWDSKSVGRKSGTRAPLP